MPKHLRVLIVSLNTYSSPSNDGKLAELGSRLENLAAVAGDLSTLWGKNNSARSGYGYQVHVLPARFSWRNATAQLVGLHEIAQGANPSIIHVECEPWQMVAWQSVRLARRLGVPVGIQFAENGPNLHGSSGGLRRLVARNLLEQCAYAIGWSAESTAVARELVPTIRTETLPGTGVPTPWLRCPRSQSRSDVWFGSGSASVAKVAFVGRFSPEKGLRDFLAICDSLAGRIPVRVAIAGGETADPELDAWLRARPWATTHGVLQRAEVGELLMAADALVAPSRTTSFAKEQFGKSSAEAMALGTPVFAYDCGALREVIGDGGHIVEEGSVAGLAAALERYLVTRLDPVASEFSARARARARIYADEALAERLIGLWTSLLRETERNERS